VRRRDVIFSPEAESDLHALSDYISSIAGSSVSDIYINRVEAFLLNFDLASERGQTRDDIRPGLRIVGFERKITVAFTVGELEITILRLFYGGQNWEEAL
jgi:toxin ParE1/3/4